MTGAIIPFGDPKGNRPLGQPTSSRYIDAMPIFLSGAKKPEDFVIPGFRAGTVGSLVAPGGTGKSFLAMELAMAVASPRADVGRFRPSGHGKVLYLNGEDHPDELSDRLFDLGRKTHPSVWPGLAKNLFVSPGYGLNLDFGGDARECEALGWLIEAHKGFRLIILDTLSRFHRLDENNNAQMAYLVGNLERVAKETGASVLFLHHANKCAIRENGGESQAASRGASALVDNARFCSYLKKMAPEEAPSYGVSAEKSGLYLKFGVSKQNSGSPQSPRWFKRDLETGILLPTELERKPAQDRPANKPAHRKPETI